MNHSFSKRGLKVIGVTVLIYAILVAPHEGEFWPLSIYPMFSQAGNPWTRAMVVDVTQKPENEIWERYALQDLDAEVVPLVNFGVDQIDFSNFVSKTEHWSDTRRNALITMFGSQTIGSQRWMVSKVRGEMVGSDSVSVEVIPFILITSDSTYLNPNIHESDYMWGE